MEIWSVIGLWDQDKFEKWRKRETEGYGESSKGRELGIVTLEAKRRGRGRGRVRSRGGN